MSGEVDDRKLQETDSRGGGVAMDQAAGQNLAGDSNLRPGLDANFSRGPPDSVREQCGDSDGLEHAARHSAQDEFPEPGMAVAAHHDQITVVVGGQRQDCVVNV